jgi:hypothetical protein
MKGDDRVITIAIFVFGAVRDVTLQTFVISPKEKNNVWVKQNVYFFQQNGSVIKMEQN